MLTDEDKLRIIEQRLTRLDQSRYELTLDIETSNGAETELKTELSKQNYIANILSNKRKEIITKRGNITA